MIASLTLLLLAQDLPAQERAEVRDLSPLLAERVAAEGMPALTAWISNGERTIARGVAGVRVRGGAAPATLDDLWHIGSCTKSMTASLMVALVMAGVDLHEGLTPLMVFPELAATADTSWKEVTLRRLLTNRAGVVGDLSGVHPELWSRCFRGDLTPLAQRRFLLETLLAQPTAQPPGSTYLYSNAGFALAGTMLEVRAGAPYEELMRRHLFGPLGMRSASFGPPGISTDPTAPDAPWGHDAAGRAHPPDLSADNPSVITPAGRVHLNMEDWARYARFHLRGEQEDRPFAPKLAMQRLHEPENREARPLYAAGWIVAEIGDPPTRLLGHSGSNTMWYSVIWLFPELDLAVLAACNDGTKGAAVERLMLDLFTTERARLR